MVTLHLDPPTQRLALDHHRASSTLHSHQLLPSLGSCLLLGLQTEKCLDPPQETLLFCGIGLTRSLQHRTPLDFRCLLDHRVHLGIAESELLIGGGLIVSNLIGC